MSFTYSLTAPQSTLHQVRLLIGDTNSTDYIFEDEELTTLLSLAGSRPFSAAALAYETWARDSAKLLKRTVYGDETKERFSPSELLALAKSMRESERSGTGPAVGKLRNRANYDITNPGDQWVMPSGITPTIPVETDLGNSDGE